MPASVRDLREAVQFWMEERDLAGCALWYSAPEWRDRNESCGNDAAVTLVMDGAPMYRVLNRTNPADQALFDHFTRLVEFLGYRFELGYSWAAHFYARSRDSAMTLPPGGDGGARAGWACFP
jgi:hypothetical protein